MATHSTPATIWQATTPTRTPTPLPTNTPIATAIPTLSALAITISPASVFAGAPSVLVHVEARDQNGNIVPSYRGTVTFGSTSAQSGLPTGGLIGGRYTFTAADAGAHDWAGVTLNTPGQQTITVDDDGGRTATSNAVAVLALHLSITAAPTTVFAGEAKLTIHVEARDQNGNIVPSYRGTVTFGSTSAQSGLPTGGLIGGRYTFTAADAGAHDWAGVTLNTPGQQTITVDDDGGRVATSNSVIVQAIHLTLSVSPTTIFAGEPGLTVRVEARDQNNTLVPGYRGTVGFSSTSAQSGLPTISLGHLGYTFTAADAGAHAWPDVTLYTAGQHTITVDDGTRQATSSATQVNETIFRLTFNTPSSYVNDRTLTATLDVVDSAGQLVRGYRGEIDLNPSVAMLNLPQTTFQATSDYVFTAADAGHHVFPNLAFSAAGTQSLTAMIAGITHARRQGA